MEKSVKRQFLLVGFGVVLFAVLMNMQEFFAFLGKAWELIAPVLLGFFFAFLLNVPMRGFENLLAKAARRTRHPPRRKLRRLVSLILTLLCMLLVIALLCTLIIPDLVASVSSLYTLIAEKWPEWAEALKGYNIDSAMLVHWFDTFDLNQLMEILSGGAGSLISSAVDFVSGAVSRVISFGVAFIIAIYVLLCKNDLTRQVKKLMTAHLKESTVSSLLHVWDLTNETFSRFLSGHCVEACILGALITIFLGIFGIPYASLIGVLTAALAFIPYVGAITSCVIGAFLVFLADPSKVLLCLVIYQAVQLIENQFIYPHVVGAAVDLPPLWTLIAVFIGGKLMGLLGMLFFIPLFAIAMILIRENTNRTLARREAAQCADDEPQCTDEPQGDGKDGQ